MNDKTYISIEFWQLVGFLLSFLGVCYGFAKMLLAQFQGQQSERAEQQAKVNAKVEELSQKYYEFQATLPHTYVLREDYIRGQAVLEAKMDAVHKTLSELYKLESIRK